MERFLVVLSVLVGLPVNISSQHPVSLIVLTETYIIIQEYVG